MDDEQVPPEQEQQQEEEEKDQSEEENQPEEEEQVCGFRCVIVRFGVAARRAYALTPSLSSHRRTALRMPPVQCADADPLCPMYCQWRGREGGAGAGHGGRTLHIQHCPNSRSDGTRPCCRTMEIVSLVSLVYVKWDLSPSRAVRGGVPIEGRP